MGSFFKIFYHSSIVYNYYLAVFIILFSAAAVIANAVKYSQFLIYLIFERLRLFPRQPAAISSKKPIYKLARESIMFGIGVRLLFYDKNTPPFPFALINGP